MSDLVSFYDQVLAQDAAEVIITLPGPAPAGDPQPHTVVLRGSRIQTVSSGPFDALLMQFGPPPPAGIDTTLANYNYVGLNANAATGVQAHGYEGQWENIIEVPVAG